MNFYKHYMGDYQTETGHLTFIEHGAYRQMLDTYYATGRPLPSDQQALYRLLRAISKEEKEAVNSILSQYWKQVDGGYINERAYREIADAQAYADAQALRSHKRWDKQAQCPDDASHSHSHSQIPDTKSKEKKSAAQKRRAEDSRPQTREEFLKSCLESPRPEIKLIGEWAELTGADFNSRGAWQQYIKRHLRAAQACSNFTESQQAAGWKKLKAAIKSEKNPKGYLTIYTLETLSKFITGAQA